MKRKLSLIIILLTICFLTKPALGKEPLFINNNKPDNGKHSIISDSSQYATLYIYRSRKFSGSGNFFKLYMDDSETSGKLLGKIKNGTHIELKLSVSEKVTFKAETELKKGVSLSPKAGKSYYLRCSIQRIFGYAKPVLEFVDEGIGKEEYSLLLK